MAQKAKVHGFINSKPKSYYERVGERGLKLSGGEKQRLAIARALLKKSPIMLFDEATSALDTETEKSIQNEINEASKNRTSLMIAHRLSTVQKCDRIIVLKLGQIIEEGTHDELLELEGEYHKLWHMQTQKEQQEEEEKKLKEELEKEKSEFLERRRTESQMKKPDSEGYKKLE